MASSKSLKGKSMPSSLSNISIRYHTEDEQLEELYETSENKSDSQTDENNLAQSSASVNESQPTETKSSGVLGRLSKRSVSLETPIQEIKETTSGDTWRLFREVRGRITKTVEEKIEEIKSERLKKDQNKNKQFVGQMEHSSMSDSEDVSENSASLKENVEKNENKYAKGTSDSKKDNNESKQIKQNNDDKHDKEDKKIKNNNEKHLISSIVKNENKHAKENNGNKIQESKTKERADESLKDTSEEKSTPIVTRIEDSEKHTPTKKVKEKRKKSKVCLNESETTDVFKTTMTYSKLCDKENEEDRPSIEIGLEARELEEPFNPCYSQMIRDTAKPSFLVTLFNIISDWLFVILPVLAVIIHWVIKLSAQTLSFLLGVIITFECQMIFSYIKKKLNLTEPLGVQLNKNCEEIFLAKVEPLLRFSEYRNVPKHPEKIVYEGWMNQYTNEYKPETYHISLSKSVYVRLEGSIITLAYPRNKVAKRAMWNEVKPKMLFDSVHTFDIYNCQVLLLPRGLIHRRCWSKKYPICIKLKPSSSLGVRFRDKGQETVDDHFKVDAAEETDVLSGSGSLGSEDSDEDKIEDSHFIMESESEYSLRDFKSQTASRKDDDDDSDDEFVKVTMVCLDDTNLYMFARSDREKEIWFRRFVAAVSFPGDNVLHSAEEIEDSLEKQSDRRDIEQHYLDFMHHLTQREPLELPTVKESNNKASAPNKTLPISPDLMWFNLFFGRLLYDVLEDNNLLDKIQEKIQRKMSAIKLPFFMEQLVVSHIDYGKKIPIVQRSTRPRIDSEGIWVDLDIIYEGGFKMTVDTKLNLMKLKTHQGTNDLPSDSPSNSPNRSVESPPKVVKLAVFDSEVEDSAESSSEEPDLSRLTTADPNSSPAASGKYMRFLETVAQSKYFQQVTDYRVIRNMMEGLSNTNITLLVEVQGLVGTLVLNLPSPPTDRLWYGFRSNPMIWISATPKFGERAVTMLNITRFIERKLCKEFEKLLVLPNMDDLVIPLMNKAMPS